jgi:hypothetical protein
MTSLQYLDFVNIQMPREKVERIMTVGLMNVKDVIANYLPMEMVSQKKAIMFDTLSELIC